MPNTPNRPVTRSMTAAAAEKARRKVATDALSLEMETQTSAAIAGPYEPNKNCDKPGSICTISGGRRRRTRRTRRSRRSRRTRRYSRR